MSSHCRGFPVSSSMGPHRSPRVTTDYRPGASQAGRASKGRSSGEAGGVLSVPRSDPISFPMAETGHTAAKRCRGRKRQSQVLPLFIWQRGFCSPVTLSGSLGLRVQEGIRNRGLCWERGTGPRPAYRCRQCEIRDEGRGRGGAAGTGVRRPGVRQRAGCAGEAQP